MPENLKEAQYANGKSLPENLSLRDFFAGCALIGYLASVNFDTYCDAREAATEAYNYAEKMIEERSMP